jgi:O-6-methylguanine DNA methyltransferase
MNHTEQETFPETRGLLRQLADLGDVRAPASIIPTVLARVGLSDAYWGLASPIGPVFVAYGDHGISALMAAEEPARFEDTYRARFGRNIRRIDQRPHALAQAIEACMSGRRTETLRFDLRGLTTFEEAVLRKALEIPWGQVRPYAWIAKEIGRPRAARAVGSALGRNPIPLLIPCHRVVRSDGRIGHYIFGSEAKRTLLRAEGVLPTDASVE